MNIGPMLDRCGRPLHLHCANGKIIQTVSCILTPLRYKNKMYLEGVPTDIGIDDSGYYLMLAPSEIMIDKLGDEGYICDGEAKFHIDKWEKIYFGRNVLYIWAVLKKHTTGNYPVYNHFTERR